MTGKERIITALWNKQPDRIPVCPGASEMWPVRMTGKSYIELFYYEKQNIWPLRLKFIEEFDCDGFIHGSLGDGPDAPEITEKLILDKPDRKVVEYTAHTKKGDLTQELIYFEKEPVSIRKGWVTNPVDEWEKVLCFLVDPDTRDASDFEEEYRLAGEDTMVGYWISSPMDWWAILRRSPQFAILDLYDYPDLMKKIFDIYTEYCAEEIRVACEKLKPDSIGLGGSSCSMSVISPTILRDWIIPWVNRVSGVAHRYKIPVQFHMCGRSRPAVDIFANESDIDALEPLERHPTGDVDLREVKEKFGKRLSLKGNVNSIDTMLHGTPDDVEREVKECIEAAAEGGGYVLAVGDQIPYWAPEENIRMLVEAGRRYGNY